MIRSERKNNLQNGCGVCRVDRRCEPKKPGRGQNDSVGLTYLSRILSAISIDRIPRVERLDTTRYERSSKVLPLTNLFSSRLAHRKFDLLSTARGSGQTCHIAEGFDYCEHEVAAFPRGRSVGRSVGLLEDVIEHHVGESLPKIAASLRSDAN